MSRNFSNLENGAELIHPFKSGLLYTCTFSAQSLKFFSQKIHLTMLGIAMITPAVARKLSATTRSAIG